MNIKLLMAKYKFIIRENVFVVLVLYSLMLFLLKTYFKPKWTELLPHIDIIGVIMWGSSTYLSLLNVWPRSMLSGSTN